MKFTFLALAGLLATGTGQQTDDDEQIVKLTSHTPLSLSEITDMIEVAGKRNLRGQVDINDLTNCDTNDKEPDNKKRTIRHMREKSITLLYNYEPKNKN